MRKNLAVSGLIESRNSLLNELPKIDSLIASEAGPLIILPRTYTVAACTTTCVTAVNLQNERRDEREEGKKERWTYHHPRHHRRHPSRGVCLASTLA